MERGQPGLKAGEQQRAAASMLPVASASECLLPEGMDDLRAGEASPGSEALRTADVVIGAHETSEAEAAPELEMNARVGHVPIELETVAGGDPESPEPIDWSEATKAPGHKAHDAG